MSPNQASRKTQLISFWSVHLYSGMMYLSYLERQVGPDGRDALSSSGEVDGWGIRCLDSAKGRGSGRWISGIWRIWRISGICENFPLKNWQNLKEKIIILRNYLLWLKRDKLAEGPCQTVQGVQFPGIYLGNVGEKLIKRKKKRNKFAIKRIN